MEDKNTVEQMRLIQQLDDDDKTTVLKIIYKMLTTKKFIDFFQKNVAALSKKGHNKKAISIFY